jgi:peptide chain release factor
VQLQFKKHLHKHGVDFKVSAQKLGPVSQSMESIAFEITNVDQKLVAPWLGTIQWVCKSPLRKYHKRKNWFLKCVQVSMGQKIAIRKQDVHVQYFKASGPGGQHRNKVETGVRLTDSQTGIVVSATNSRSQTQNKKLAWQRLDSAVKRIQKQRVSNLDFEHWSKQIEIERGNPAKIFEGLKFIEKR